jgi:phosphoribosyl-AMP cyclohydrolase
MAADFVAIKAENDAVIKAANQQLQTWDEGYKGQIEVAKIASETKIQLITQDFEKGKIIQQQEIALIAKEKQDELALEIFYQRQRQALWDKDPKKVQEIQNQIDKIKAQSELVAAKAQTDSLRVQQKNLAQFFSRAKSAMDQSISGFLKGTESFAKAWQNMWADYGGFHGTEAG